MAGQVEDFVRQNRQEADFVEQFQALSESEKHWGARREFILRYLPEFRGSQRLDQLLALSMVWANHVFLGCRYSEELMERVTEMAEGIEVEDAPQFTTRDEIMKKLHH
ncbi:CDKN2AIP N-terminal-like protein [Latimeria chalumnae]|uniref:CDKN2A interacting protein N-terminal like n=1 Tax=Latimeria chalumnae TaxID=7897 RepID=H3B8Y4_LATCH|nr:PREDICTED: CDKN2AIP N-terminal-like protein isoform X2 [Latimeria chalumnae]|eukprot:XP_005989403.1 PREDICTED: CDKN2AIP N-terminal-like protein isoform X2 [Latimeria chalumnae]